MPANFPEVWLARVETNLTNQDIAPWLEGIEELDTEIIEMGSGSTGESNVIHLPVSEFEPDVLINNSTYPLALQAYTDTEVTISLDKYQTKVVTLTDDQIIGASYRRIDNATRATSGAITKKKYAKGIHAIAPAGHTTNTPIHETTGAVRGGAAIGRKILTYDDLVAHKEQYDALEVPEVGRRLVLCADHWNDLLLDRGRFGDQFSNYRTGKLAPMVAGFELIQNSYNPYYTGKVKKAFGAAPVAGDYKASVSFYVPNVAKKTGMTKQYFTPASADPENQTNKLSYRHYFIAVPKRAKYIGAIVSGVVEE